MRNLFHDVSTPCVYLKWENFLENITKVIQSVGNKKVRIATKSIRCTSILSFLQQYDDKFDGLMCYSPYEAVFLSQKDFDNILLGYPIMDYEGIKQIAYEVSKKKKIIFMCDDVLQIDLIEHVAQELQVSLSICLDIDMSTKFGPLHFGVRRSPITNVIQIDVLLKKFANNPYIKLVGVMGYEAQIAGVADNVPNMLFKNKLIQGLKKMSYKTIKHRREEIVKYIENQGFPLQLVNGGGSGSVHSTREESVITEITVGSAFYSPSLFMQYKEYDYKNAIGYALPIVRKPAKNIYTVTSGGFIASGSTNLDKQPTPIEPKGSSLLSLEGAGEVQTPVFYDGDEDLDIGDVILFQPSKAGEIAERFKNIYIIENNKIREQFLTYRGEGECFL